jgi:hypothetical protein
LKTRVADKTELHDSFVSKSIIDQPRILRFGEVEETMISDKSAMSRPDFNKLAEDFVRAMGLMALGCALAAIPFVANVDGWQAVLFAVPAVGAFATGVYRLRTA